MLTPDSILHFFQKSTRAKNDATNRIRETILSLLNRPTEYMAMEEDAVYGQQWKTVRMEFEKELRAILRERGAECSSFTYSLTHKGGQANNHDFDVTVISSATQQLLLSFNMEFKFNSVPQFANHYDHEGYCPKTLAEYWWDEGIVDQMCGVYEGLKFPKPGTREDYLKLVRKDPKSFAEGFTRQFYDLDHAGKDERYKQRDAIVKQGIGRYLDTYAAAFSVPKLVQKIIAENQVEKVYMVWKPQKMRFERSMYTKEELTPTEVLRVKNRNTVVLKAGAREMHCLLRWKNTIGVGVPAWQISIK